jgi:hypothetical protein
MSGYGLGPYGLGPYGVSPWDAPVLTQPPPLDLLITRIGGRDPVTLVASDLAASWSVQQGGLLSAIAVTTDVLAAFGTVDLRGRWLSWRHPALGTWSGVITDVVPTSEGVTELAAGDFRLLLDRRRTAKVYDLQAATPGGIVKRLIADATRQEPLWIDDVTADEQGIPVAYQSRADDLLAAVTDLASASGQEWRVTAERVLEWRLRLGTDQTASVELVEGRHLAEWRFPHALAPITNDLLAVPSNTDYQQTRAVVVRDEASIQAHGLRQGGTVITEAVSEAMLRPKAAALVAQTAWAGRAFEATVLDEDDVWAAFAEGDRIRVLLPSLDASVVCRVMVRSYDARSNSLRITGDIWEAGG